MTNPPFMRDKELPPLHLRGLTPDEIEFVAREKRLLAQAYEKMQAAAEPETSK